MEWHPTKNGDLTPDSVLAYTVKEAVWLGKCGHEWPASVAHRTKGSGCPYCNNTLVLKGFNDLATTHPEYAAEWHPIKNNFSPDEVTFGSPKKGLVAWKMRSRMGGHYRQQNLRKTRLPLLFKQETAQGV